MMSVPFDQPDAALPQVLQALKQPVDAVLAADDHGVALAAQLRVEVWRSQNANNRNQGRAAR